MSELARGGFEVVLTPMPPEEMQGDGPPARMTIQKNIVGDLEGESVGQMLSAMTDVEGSAGYVAIERITGTLGGRSGSFVLHHMGTMDRGEPSLAITVVPDSGTEGLTGISGSMLIDIVDGVHSYEFTYDLPEGEPAAA